MVEFPGSPVWTFTELLHRRKQLLTVSVRRKINALALLDAPTSALYEIGLFWHFVAKPWRLTADIQTGAHEKRRREHAGQARCYARKRNYRASKPSDPRQENQSALIQHPCAAPP